MKNFFGILSVVELFLSMVLRVQHDTAAATYFLGVAILFALWEIA